ncbi:protein male-specific lethal-1 [Drosophila innubila]|uniref:protein male-specific lethal-1 n=1 Tax=Drosophila innubila TaxID=198719 RepID=UPI00148E294F|nr:protein male-specific lethal-1 [Drosophila innubila]
MDKRYKWNVSQQRGGYVEPQQAYGQHMPRSAYQLPFKNYSRLNHSYSYGKHNAPAPSNNYYKKPPPPPPVHARESGGNWLAQAAESESAQNNSSEVVTLIVENNNLKNMILLHMNLMQEQTDQLKGKDKELDDQSGRIKTLLSQNQELMQQIAKLSQRIDDLRNQLRRCVKRTANDDEEQQMSVPKAKIQCYVEKQTQTLDLLHEEQEEVEAEEEAVIHRYESPKVIVTSVTDLPPTQPVASVLDNSKGRGEFNGGKKVSTIFLHRVHQEKSCIQLQDDEQRQEEEQDMEDEQEANDLQRVVEEEQVEEAEEHIYAADEMEVVNETEIGAEHELVTEEVAEDDPVNNGHIYEEEVVEQEIDNNCGTSNLWQHETTQQEHEVEAEEEENESSEEEHETEEEDDDEAESEDETEPVPEPEEEKVTEAVQDQMYVVEEEVEIGQDSPFAHSTPHPKQMELKEKQQQEQQLESQITQEEREEEKQPSPELQMEQLNNKLELELELEDQQQQQKLIEMECQQLIMEHEVHVNQVEVQSVEMLHVVQEEEVEMTQTNHIDTMSLKANVTTKSNHQAPKPKIEGIVVKSKQQSTTRTPKTSENETQTATVNDDADWRLSKEQIDASMKSIVPRFPSKPIEAESAIERKERKKRELKEKEKRLKKLLRQKKERNVQRIRELKREKELQREQEGEREKQRVREQKKELEREREERERDQEKQQAKHQEQQQQQPSKANIDEAEMMRKLKEHLQKQQQRLQQNQQQNQLNQNPTVRIKKQSMLSTSLIYPPIAPAASTITPAPSPTNAASPKLKPSTNNNNNNNSNSSSSTTTIQTPLTPQSISSVGSNSNSNNSNNNNNRRTVVNNCSPHTYSKQSSNNSKSSGKSSSRFVTSLQPYTTRSWEDQEFHCDNEFFLEEADELHADNPSLEIPKWKVVQLRHSADHKNIEPLSDAAFEERHDKYVRDEKERKRRDERVIREQIRINELRSRHNQDEVLVALDPLPTSTFYPLPEDIEGIQFVSEVPVQAFGENMVNLQEQGDYFSLPWLDAATATTAIAKAKADALPVATLDSKKLPTTYAEAKHLQNNSSYVFLKLRKRQRRR